MSTCSPDLLNFGYLAEEQCGATALSSAIGVWSVTVALATAVIEASRRAQRPPPSGVHHGQRSRLRRFRLHRHDFRYPRIVRRWPQYGARELPHRRRIRVWKAPVSLSSADPSRWKGQPKQSPGSATIANDTFGSRPGEMWITALFIPRPVENSTELSTRPHGRNPSTGVIHTVDSYTCVV